MLGYRRRILALCTQLLSPLPRLSPALDFGCGDGWFVKSFREHKLMEDITAVEIKRRRMCHVEPILYSGGRLPFEDRSFELTYCIDVLHHCPRPVDALVDLLRCTRRYVMVKDHVHFTWLGRLLLCVMDEAGNRPAGVRSPYKYQKNWEWDACFDEHGFEIEPYLPGPMPSSTALFANRPPALYKPLASSCRNHDSSIPLEDPPGRGQGENEHYINYQ